MDTTLETLLAELKRRHISLSHQRLKVLEYLCQNQTHPTAEQIYSHLRKQVPTLSRTTVYNTLDLLVKACLVRALTIDEHEVRYDIVTQVHGHFQCQRCGAIFNFSVDPAAISVRELSRFKVMSRDVYFKGICPQCLQNAGTAGEPDD